MNIQLVSSASQFWKKYSTWIFSAIAIIAGLQPFTPFLQIILPGNVFNFVLACISLAGILLTQVKQPNIVVPPAAE